MDSIINKISEIGIVPVIAIQDVEKAVPLAKALIDGGIPCAEITFRTSAGEEAIRRISKAFPDMLLGAGTVLSTAQVDKAIDAGAKFIVSPGFNPKVVDYCISKNIIIVPGCVTPSEIEQAIDKGLNTVKFFPAEQAGGLDYIKSVSAPYSTLQFMPTGGINIHNINSYLSFEKVLACGGTWMVKKDLIENSDFEQISWLCREAMKTVLGFKLKHIGINTANENEALQTAKLFEAMFGFSPSEKNSAIFADDCIEILKKPFLGEHGHIAIAVNNVKRAQAFLERKGFAFDEDTAKISSDGRKTVIYLKEQIAGFAIHLIQN